MKELQIELDENINHVQSELQERFEEIIGEFIQESFGE